MSDGRGVAVLLVGVGGAPAELLRSAEQILGPLPDVTALGFAPDAAREAVDERLRRAATEVSRGGGVLLIADLCGSTLANVCYAVASEEVGYDVLCGLNLAMLMKLFSTDREALDATALAHALADTGRRGICLFSDTNAGRAGGSMSDSERHQIEVVIVNRTGLHTRPAKEFVQVASQFAAAIEVSKGDRPVNGKSIMGLMSLLAPQGTRLTISATGPDAAEAIRALEVVVNERFGEVE